MTFLLVLAVLAWTLGLVLAVLGKLLRAPDRSARVTVRPLPWPRIEITVEAAGPPPPGCGTNGRNMDRAGAHDVHNCPSQQVSTA